MNTQSRSWCRTRLAHPLMALAVLALLALPLCAFAQDAATETDVAVEESSDGSAEGVESMSLKADEEDTVLRSLVIEGEDRIQIEFERPLLDLHIDGYGIEGLAWGETMDVVQRREVDALSPMIQDSNDGGPKASRVPGSGSCATARWRAFGHPWTEWPAGA